MEASVAELNVMLDEMGHEEVQAGGTMTLFCAGNIPNTEPVTLFGVVRMVVPGPIVCVLGPKVVHSLPVTVVGGAAAKTMRPSPLISLCSLFGANWQVAPVTLMVPDAVAVTPPAVSTICTVTLEAAQKFAQRPYHPRSECTCRFLQRGPWKRAWQS